MSCPWEPVNASNPPTCVIQPQTAHIQLVSINNSIHLKVNRKAWQEHQRYEKNEHQYVMVHLQQHKVAALKIKPKKHPERDERVGGMHTRW